MTGGILLQPKRKYEDLGVPILDIHLNGVTLDEIDNGNKTDVYGGNELTIYDGDFLNTYNEIDFDRIQLELPERYHGIDFIAPNFKSGELNTEPDGSQFFRQSENQYKREELVNSTYFGLKTRSKSEAMIAETLYRNKFSLYYEKRLFLVDAFGNPRTVYPDFTIPIGRNHVVYWEHKGLLGSDEYLLRDAEKTRLYHINGIYQPKNLIVTAEKNGGGLDNEYVEYLVCGFLEHVRKNLVNI